MAIKFSQFNLRTDHTEGMYLVGYDGNQNIHITVDNLFDDFINGTENTIAMFGTGGTVLADSILSQDAGATLLTVAGQLNVDAAATFDTSITVTGDSTLNGNVILGDASTDLITQTGTLYLNGPVKDTTDTLGAVDQVLLSDATGELTFTDLAELHVGGAEVVEVPVKNVQGSALVKGDPVYISGSVGASGRLEVQLADASNTAKMPAVGLLKQNLANNAEGFAVVTGKLRNLITDPIDGVNPTENDVIYVKPSGISGAALTTTKPVYGNFIQNIGKVGRVSTSNDGNLVVSSILRTNDIPNLTPGRLWVGSTGNTIESQTLFVDEANARLGIGTTSPDSNLHVLTSTGSSQIKLTSQANTQFQFYGDGNQDINYGLPPNFPSPGGDAVGQIRYSHGSNYMAFKVNNAERVRFKSSGQIQFNQYGAGAFPGTATKNLAVDSSGNVIETDGGVVDGSGTANYVAKWFDTDTITDSVIYDNGTNVGIGTSSPGEKLVVSETRTGATASNLYTTVIKSVQSAGASPNPGTGGLKVQYYDGASNHAFGLVAGTTSSDFLTTGPMHFYTNSDLDTVSATGFAMVLNNNGWLGIGTTNPSHKLTVADGQFHHIHLLSGNIMSKMFIGYNGTNYNGQLEMFQDTTSKVYITANGDSYFNGGNVGIGTTSPSSKLQVNGAVQVADDTDTASASKVGALRYRTSGNNSYVDMCMQTGPTTYEWVNIVQNNW